MAAARVATLWRRAGAVCFDVDSTVIREEGIDALAAFLGKGVEVAAFTKRCARVKRHRRGRSGSVSSLAVHSAMEGGLPYEEALRARLDIMRPSRGAVEAFLAKHPAPLSDGASRGRDAGGQSIFPSPPLCHGDSLPRAQARWRCFPDSAPAACRRSSCPAGFSRCARPPASPNLPAPST